MRHDLELNWKAFNVNMNKVDEWCRENAGELYAGVSGGAKITVHFHSKPADVVLNDVRAYWEALEDSDTEATSYKSKDELQDEKDAKKASAIAKLEALGLDADEIAAILG